MNRTSIGISTEMAEEANLSEILIKQMGAKHESYHTCPDPFLMWLTQISATRLATESATHSF